VLIVVDLDVVLEFGVLESVFNASLIVCRVSFPTKGAGSRGVL